MDKATIIVYQDAKGAPVLNWLEDVRHSDLTGWASRRRPIPTTETTTMKSRNALEHLRRVADANAGAAEALQKARVNARVAQLIYTLRTEAGLTQQQLAEKVGTRQPVIARLEDADYGGHSLTMLARIASALGYELDIHFKRPEVEQPSSRERNAGGPRPSK